MKELIPYGRQSIDEEDIQAAVDVLRSDWITQGPAIEQFERALADYCGAKYAVAVSSGTAGLHLACLAAGVGPGGSVVTSPITFVASANCALYAGGRPRFADIDPSTLNISPEAIERLLDTEEVSAVIPVHFAGLPCDMEKIGGMAKARGVAVIEDACHALGAEYLSSSGDWLKVGACRHSDMTVFSFHPVKHITTGEGGAVTTNDEDLYRKLVKLRAHGITKEKGELVQADGGPWYYEMQLLGLNYRLTDFQCALGLSQLKKLPGWLARRRAIAAKYDSAFAGQDKITLPPSGPKWKSAYHLYVIQVANRRVVFDQLRDRGLGVQVHYIPVHLQPYYRDRFGYGPGDYVASEAYYERCISLPIYPKMTDQDVDRVVDAVRGVFAQ